jgi:hypothetical protein
MYGCAALQQQRHNLRSAVGQVLQRRQHLQKKIYKEEAGKKSGEAHN